MIINVYTKYDVYGMTEVELPEGKTVDDIKDIWLKSCEGSIEFTDGTIEEGYFEDNQEENGEWFKRPVELSFEELGGNFNYVISNGRWNRNGEMK